MQTGIIDWLAQNTFLTFGMFFIFFVVVSAIYLKIYVRIIYAGTTYKHYRKGRLLRESDKGGAVFLIPFLDKLEIIPSTSSSIGDIADSFDEDE